MTNYSIRYYAEVSEDIRLAKYWYKQQQNGLQKRFATDVKLTIKRLAKNPLHYEIRYRKVRIAYCEIFPYAIHFYIDDLMIVIVAVIHQHRNPEYSQKRQLK